jgi:hypothetical protein
MEEDMDIQFQHLRGGLKKYTQSPVKITFPKTDFGTRSAYYETGAQSAQSRLVLKSSTLF